jgi:hypothetical protein
MGLLLSSSFDGVVRFFLLFDRAAGFLPPRPQILTAVARRSCQGWPPHRPFHISPPLPGHTLTASSTTARLELSGRRSEGSPLFRARVNRAATLYPAGPKTRTMMQPCASASEAPNRRAHSSLRHESHGNPSGPATSNRHRRPSQVNRPNRNCRCFQRSLFIAPGAE